MNFQKPVLPDETKRSIIDELYFTKHTPDSYQEIAKESLGAEQVEKEKRLAGEFGEQAKKHPTMLELEHGFRAAVATQFRHHHIKDDDWDPWKQFGVENPHVS